MNHSAHFLNVLGAAVAVLLGLGAISACGGEQANATPPAVAKAAVAKIVFVDQEEACECTRKRIDGTWTELQKALGDDPKVPVERIHGDSQEEQAKPYIAMRALMVAPGLYFLDAEGQLLEMLQGELTEAQIAALLE